MNRTLRTLAAAAGVIGATVAVYASETATYTYDARGRLVKVKREGTVNNNVQAEYRYDKADNRTTVNVIQPAPPPK